MSKKLKLSPWHSGDVKPVHVGVYEVYCICCNQIWYSKWNGRFFCEVEDKIFYASLQKYKDLNLKVIKWRGILK